MSTEVVIEPPRSLMEVFKILPEGTPVQLIENNLIMSPAPRDSHQKILTDIYLQLGNFVKENHLGETRVAPYDVYLGDENAFQPDIVFISKQRLHLIKEDGLHGAPDLVIEILSPSTAQHDLGAKKDVYERFGVKEYWTVEPDSKAVQGWFWEAGFYSEISSEDAILSSKLLSKSFSF